MAFYASDIVTTFIAEQDVLAKAEKKGEGSRGGKIIGHTKSGKPVYAATASSHGYIKRGPENSYDSSNHTAHTRLTVAMHPDWNRKDHEDAGSIHQREEARLSGEGRSKEALHSSNAMIAHFTASGEIARHPELRPAIEKSAKGEGSRGGHIIGHTKSGKPIYGTSSGHRIPKANHPHYKGLRLGIGHESDEARSGARGIHIDRHFGFFSAKDHDQAAAHHNAMAAETKSHITRARHEAAADGHKAAAMMSRAGYVPHQVIGYTQSKKPITANSGLRGDEVYSDNHAVLMANLGFSQRDHEDAANVHRFHRDAAKNPIISQLHHGAMQAHENASQSKVFMTDFAAQNGFGQGTKKMLPAANLAALEALRKAAKKGEGSRGGHIIGHTRSGKPVYGASGSKYAHIKDSALTGDHRAGAGARQSYPDFSLLDHHDAYEMHLKNGDHHSRLAGRADANGRHDLAQAHHTIAGSHMLAAAGHKYAGQLMQAEGHIYPPSGP